MLNDLSPLLIPIIGVCIPIVAIVGGLLYKWNREQMLHETIRQLAAKGQPIPPELLAGRTPRAGAAPASPAGPAALRSGVKLVAVGIGLALMFRVMQPNDWLWAIGMIPLCLGLGYLVLWKLESPRTP